MSPDPHRWIEVENIGDVAVVTFLKGKLFDDTTADFSTLVDDIDRRKVLLNFGTVEFMSSYVLGQLIVLHRKVQAVRGALAFCKLRPDILEVFGITRLDRVFTVVTDPTLGVGAVINRAFGNPFRASRFSPEWRTDTVLLLARQMDESGEFGAMPILADALQDAGCDNDEILDHCRSGSEYFQEGWVVDRVLEQE